jgi:hypothetical protein
MDIGMESACRQSRWHPDLRKFLPIKPVLATILKVPINKNIMGLQKSNFKEKMNSRGSQHLHIGYKLSFEEWI